VCGFLEQESDVVVKRQGGTHAQHHSVLIFRHQDDERLPAAGRQAHPALHAGP
jgi:hypothetical protein